MKLVKVDIDNNKAREPEKYGAAYRLALAIADDRGMSKVTTEFADLLNYLINKDFIYTGRAITFECPKYIKSSKLSYIFSMDGYGDDLFGEWNGSIVKFTE